MRLSLTRAPRLAALLLAFAPGLAGCGGDGTVPPPVDAGPPAVTARLEAQLESAVVRPGESRQLAFRLVDKDGEPVGGRLVRFTIVDDPKTTEDESQGASLAADQQTTDRLGHARVRVTAGLETTFRVRATAAGASRADLVVVVSTGTQVAAEIVPRVESDDPTITVTTVRLFRYDREACAMHSPVPVQPEEKGWPVRSLPLDAVAPWSGFAAAENHAIVGLGLDASGATRVAGCVDLPGRALLIQEPLRVILPLRPVVISLPPALSASSRFQLRDALRTPRVVAEGWRALAACPLDPVRLWLDCTLDGFRAGDPTDPLDCRPATDEGPIAAKIAARRGTPSAGTPACRERTTSAAAPSLEARLLSLLPTPAPPLVAQLGALANEVDALFDEVSLQSTLHVAPGTGADRFQIEHGLAQVSFGRGRVTVPVALAGAPVTRAAFVTARRARGELTIETHGFTLRLGTLARLALGRGSLTPRGAPLDPTLFAAHLFGFARTLSGRTGCGALDELVCAEIGEPVGCALSACEDGLLALSRWLDSGFVALDGEGIDFLLAGSAPLLDNDGDGQADALGRPLPGAGGPGIWSGTLRAKGSDVPFTGVWTAERAPK